MLKAEKVTGKVDATKGNGSTILTWRLMATGMPWAIKNANEPFQNAVVARVTPLTGPVIPDPLYVINGWLTRSQRRPVAPPTQSVW